MLKKLIWNQYTVNYKVANTKAENDKLIAFWSMCKL